MRTRDSIAIANRIVKYLTFETAFIIFAVGLLLSMAIKAFFDIDGNWDTWAYHLPFAARLWGMVSPTDWGLDNFFQSRYGGFALLGEFLQGFFWYVLRRPEAANLVSYLSLIVYILFLRSFFNVPFYLSTIALLAIPLVQIHATASYVDLLGGTATAIAIMAAYRFYLDYTATWRSDLLVLFMGAAIAANTRLLLIPVIGVVLVAVMPKIINNYFNGQIPYHKSRIFLYTLLLFVGLATVGATALKNTILYQNPVYPVILKIGSITLNHAEDAPIEQEIAGKHLSEPQKWFYSVFELIPKPLCRGNWTIDQNLPDGVQGAEFGGFFGAYVLVNLFVFTYLACSNWSRPTKAALIFIIAMSVLSAFMPSAFRLRYYMYWMIVMVSLNLCLISLFHSVRLLPKGISLRSFGLTCGLALAVVLISTKGVYVRPVFYSFNMFMARKADPHILSQIHDGESVCLDLPHWQFNFVYVSLFHPGKHYSIRNGSSPDECGGRKIITKH